MQSALPPPELVEEVVRLVIEESMLSVPKEQSYTFMIEGILCELAPEVEATEAQGNEEEEGSRYTPSDNEGNNANDENQIIDGVDQQVEYQYEEQVPIEARRVRRKGIMGKKQFQ